MEHYWQGYLITGGTAFARGENLRHYPSIRTINSLKRYFKVTKIVWKDGSFLCI